MDKLVGVGIFTGWLLIAALALVFGTILILVGLACAGLHVLYQRANNAFRAYIYLPERPVMDIDRELDKHSMKVPR